MNDQVQVTDDRDCLSDSHRDYMVRYVEYELAKQEQASSTARRRPAALKRPRSDRRKLRRFDARRTPAECRR